MATCPNGHESTWDDYCSSCGAPMHPAPDAGADPTVPDAPAVPEAPRAPEVSVAGPVERCPSCGEPRDPGAPFCESCGHDYSGATVVPAPAAAVAVPVSAAATLTIAADRGYFDAHSATSGLTFPEGAGEVRVALTRDVVMVGRRSDSRGVFPDVDLRATIDDPAASHRHAELRRTATGWVIVDLGSTNGTAVNGQRITEHPLHDGDELRFGATVLRYELD